jgi:hypothetical protein
MLQKPRMPQIRGGQGEAVPRYCESWPTKEMGHRGRLGWRHHTVFSKSKNRSIFMQFRGLYKLGLIPLTFQPNASLEEYTRNFRPIEGQVGAVFLIDGKVVGIDGFGKPETFSKVFRKLLESYMLDTIYQYNPQKKSRSLNAR